MDGLNGSVALEMRSEIHRRQLIRVSDSFGNFDFETPLTHAECYEVFVKGRFDFGVYVG
jgi:hypothetical protein